MSDLITISSSVLPSSTRVLGFRGVEAISRPYQFEIFLAIPSDEQDFDLADAIGGKARLVIDRADDALPPYIFAGILGGIELLHETGGRALIRATLVPRLSQLGLSRHSRIFTKKSIVDIIQAVLEDNGLSGDDVQVIVGGREPEEHVCQYRESDLDFISRWMEREGIYYYFEHTEDGEKLVLCDDLSYPAEILGSPVRYHPQLGHDRSAGPSFRSFACRYGSLPSAVKIKDYDYARPNLDLSGSAEVLSSGAGEVNLYGERFFTPAAGKRLARFRAEELLARKVVYQAAGTRPHLRAGYTFELEEHPRAAFNDCYLAIEARHHGNQAVDLAHLRDLFGLEHDDVYFVELSAIPSNTQFRPESRTPWPRIYGFENGVVDGPANSEYAQIDSHGRYLVKFRFDESNLKDGIASTYVRMMQPHGGSIEGFHFPLRKGTEVLFSFLGGDPDRPVISGVAPNALTPSPVTSGNYTQNVIQTGGRNRIELEDQGGSQYIHVSTPPQSSFLWLGVPDANNANADLSTEGDGRIHIGGNLGIDVGYTSGAGTKSESVKGSVTETYEDTKTEDVTKTLTQTVGLLVTETYNLGHDTTVNGADRTLAVTTGGYRAGINTGLGYAVAGGVSFSLNDGFGVPPPPGGGGFSVNVKENGVSIVAKKLVGVESQQEGMTLKSKGEMSVDSTDNKVKVHGKQDIEITSDANIVVRCKKWDLEAAEEHKDLEYKKDLLTLGNYKIIKFGASAEASISAKAELSLSFSLAAKLSVALELAHTIDLKEKLMKQEACMTYMLESPFIEFVGALVQVTSPLFQATSALKIL